MLAKEWQKLEPQLIDAPYFMSKLMIILHVSESVS